ncbi:hypothetical protein [uncultured Acetobacterium sp.]|uniref:hypothetical protein n=1 Tax=uncultured Acetobacterium sp. TaxID=217139 RepID=UPI0025F6A9EF|nr:hypothetical protein [uncultured Acetobacterium sp.]
MNIGMLMIVLVIVIPGYFIVRRLSTSLYSDNQKMEAETERRYGFQRLEKEITERAKAKEKNGRSCKLTDYKRAPKKTVRRPQRVDYAVLEKYHNQAETEKLNKENIKQK